MHATIVSASASDAVAVAESEAEPESGDDETRAPRRDPNPPRTASPGARGQVVLDSAELRRLRQSRLLSQQDLADDCWRRNIRVSVATIKRAESGRAVRFRIAHELARCFGVPVTALVRIAPAA
ncbi:helix-turn-helix domain-containing protein [Lysobacter sp. K5869]|uniref:helix-turn-helix domain-containing protein n=1 Tax=Lysobacter sp. K5869 TaxID=2820808 RepID=UPI001C063091|nr:helix-turn-helix domain-containing protein [Lysobacter sp. K5869]QWP75775.1 helix-turn-helix domain-containing protein [Lysobacter sp. K5869]